MNEELVQAAIQTFCIVPELYQPDLVKAGVDFPDEYVAQIKQNPESAAQLFESNEQWSDIIVKIFSTDPEKFIKAAQQAQQQTGMFKKGGKLAYLHDKSSLMKFQGGGFVRASNYYRRHGNEGTIRKIQQFLSTRGYDLGDYEFGKFDQNLYNAIRKYQGDIGVAQDGMWGEDTNSVHRVLSLGSRTFTGPNSGAHDGHTYQSNYRNQTYRAPSGTKWKTESDAYRDINSAIEQANANPEWFWSNDESASSWREFFGRINGGEDIMRQIYSDTPDEIRRTIDSKKIPTNIRVDATNEYIRDNTNTVAPYVAGALSAPIGLEALSVPVKAVTGIVGGIAGSSVGSAIENLRSGENGRYVVNDAVGARNVGAFVGGTLGWGFGDGVGVERGYNPAELDLGYQHPESTIIKQASTKTSTVRNIPRSFAQRKGPRTFAERRALNRNKGKR